MESAESTSLPDLRLQTLPPEILSTILSHIEEAELWRLRSLCHAFKAVYEDSVRHRFYRLLPHIKAQIEEHRLAVENSHFNAEKLRLSQARKMLLLKFAYREALMFSAVVWRQSFDQGAWSAVCHPVSQVVNEFYAFASHSVQWARLLDFNSIHNKLRAWNAFQTTFTTRIEPHLAEQEALVVPFSTQVVDILDCALHANWESKLEFNPGPGTKGSFSLDYWTRLRNETRRAAPSETVARAGSSAPNQKAALLRFLRRSVSENTVTEFNRILEELEPLEASVGHNIPDAMVAEMSRVYARVFQDYPHPWPALQARPTGPAHRPTGHAHRLTRQFDYDLTQSQTLVRLKLAVVAREHLPLSFWQESLRDRMGIRETGRRAGKRKGRRKKRRLNALFIEMTRHERRSRVLKSCVTVRNVDTDFRVTTSSRFFKLQCCKMHDWCYSAADCPMFLEYFIPYVWTCYHRRPLCAYGRQSCNQRLCECDRKLAECLRRYPCPRRKAVCTSSPWRLFQNLLML